MLGETWVGTVPAADVDARARGDAGLCGTVQAWCTEEVFGDDVEVDAGTGTRTKLAVGASFGTKLLACGCHFAVLAVLEDGGAVDGACLTLRVQGRSTPTSHAPIKMVQLTQLVTSTSDA